MVTAKRSQARATGVQQPQRGTIRKRGQKYQVDVYVAGEPIRRTADTAMEARGIRDHLRALSHTSASYVSLDEVLRDYVTRLRKRKAKLASIRLFESHGDRLREHFGSGFPASELTDDALEGYIETRLEDVTISTVNSSLRVLRATMRHAVKRRRLRQLPCEIELLKETNRLPTVLTVEEVRRLREQAAKPYNTIIYLAAHAGLRHAEILHMLVKDVDFERGNVLVSAKKGWTPKSHCERAVPMNRHLRPVLTEHVETLKQKSPDAWLFPGYEGRALSTAAGPVRTAFRRAGLYDPASKPGLHMLRRTFASELLGRGVDIETVRELGGWRDLVTVQRYLASTSQRKRDAVELLAS